MIRVSRYLLSVAATGALGLSSALASTVGLGTTGPHSSDRVNVDNSVNYRSNQDNQVDVGNYNHQQANTGSALDWYNTIGGGARSGDAHNNNLTNTVVNIDNGRLASLANVCWPFLGGAGGSLGASLHLTGPGSYNVIDLDNRFNYWSNVSNNVNVNNSNNQNARSGSALVWGNTIGGNANSGDAHNNNATMTDVQIANGGGSGSWSGSGAGNGNGGNYSIGLTGPGSYNAIRQDNSSSYRSDVRNDVNVNNSNNQNANSGNARVSGNTIGGNATSGDANNRNTTTTAVTVDNAGGVTLPASNGGGNGNYSIGITGPGSYNVIQALDHTNV
jgi:hypothetical protein